MLDTILYVTVVITLLANTIYVSWFIHLLNKNVRIYEINEEVQEIILERLIRLEQIIRSMQIRKTSTKRKVIEVKEIKSEPPKRKRGRPRKNA